VYGLFIRANLPIFPFPLFGGYLDGVFIIFGIVRSSEGGTRLAMPKTDQRAEYVVIEVRFRGY